jgi:hypothetical protein
MSQSLRNLIAPFRRDRKRDFASDDGAELLKSKVLQALMTRGTTPRSSGELPWRTNFGAGLELLRHQRNDDVLSELTAVYVKDTLKKWVPEVEVVETSTSRDNSSLKIKVRFISRENTGQALKQRNEAEVFLTL